MTQNCFSPATGKFGTILTENFDITKLWADIVKPLISPNIIKIIGLN